MYADDIIIMSPSIDGLQRMLDIFAKYGHSFNIV